MTDTPPPFDEDLQNFRLDDNSSLNPFEMARLQALLLRAQIAEAKEIRNNIASIGSPVYLALQRIDGHIAALQQQLKEVERNDNG